MKIQLDASLGIIFIVAAIAIVARIYSLRFNPPSNVWLFWIPFVTLVAIAGYFAVTRHDSIPILFTTALALVLHSIRPLSEAGGIDWGTDSVHDLQIAVRGVSQQHFILGDGTLVSHAFGQSFFPGMEMLTSSIHLVTGISLQTIYNFSFVFLNLATLLTFFFLMRMLTKNSQIVNIAVLLYALCPQFNGFNSFTLHESLAIIFVPLVILAVLIGKDNPFPHKRALFAVAVLSIFIVTITNEFTAYVLAAFTATIVLAPILLNALRRKPLDLDYRKISIVIVCVLSIALWLYLAAPYYLSYDGTDLIGRIMVGLNPIKSEAAAISAGAAAGPPLPFFQFVFSYTGLGLVLLLGLVGTLYYAKKHHTSILKTNPLGIISWSLISIGLLVLWKVIPWEVIGEAPVNLRIFEFSYFGLAAFGAIALYSFLSRFQTGPRKAHIFTSGTSKLLAVIIIVLIAFPIIILEYSPTQYDSQRTTVMDYSNCVSSYAAAKFISTYVNSSMIAGTEDGGLFVSGYAAKNFSYPMLTNSLKTKEILTDTYYLNLANLALPDYSRYTLNKTDYQWLHSQINRVYDSGSTVVLTNSTSW